MLNGRNGEKLKAAAAELRKEGFTVHASAFDVSDAASVHAAGAHANFAGVVTALLGRFGVELEPERHSVTARTRPHEPAVIDGDSERLGVEADFRQPIVHRRHMSWLAAMRGAGQREFLVREAEAIGCAAPEGSLDSEAPSPPSSSGMARAV